MLSCYDKNTGKSKGIGFVLFKTRSHAKDAINNIGEVYGRNITCGWSNAKPQNSNNTRGGDDSNRFQKKKFEAVVNTIFIRNLGFRTNNC